MQQIADWLGKLGLSEYAQRFAENDIDFTSGNLTGSSGFQAELEAKRLGLVRELRPDATTIGVLVNPNVAYIETQLNDIRSSAASIGREIAIVKAGTIAEIDAAFRDPQANARRCPFRCNRSVLF
jgi:ABC-type uncharacterized transport system substrate-binding protein